MLVDGLIYELYKSCCLTRYVAVADRTWLRPFLPPVWRLRTNRTAREDAQRVLVSLRRQAGPPACPAGSFLETFFGASKAAKSLGLTRPQLAYRYRKLSELNDENC